MSQTRDRVLPDHVLEQTKWHVLDTVAAMVSGSELAPGRAAITFARDPEEDPAISWEAPGCSLAVRPARRTAS
jgi:hypothetical protein